MNYRSEIDGLRALAVIPVILFHAGFSTFSGGYVGVDVFFVISGYLITTILISDLQAGNFSIVRFYERRARRILPALFFVMLVSTLFAWVLLTPDELVSFSKSIAAVSLFVSNFFFWIDGGYFETAAELKPLLHTWSLAVEEQYYIFFPIFLMLFWRFGRKFILWAVIFVAIISLAIAQVGASLRPVLNFFLLTSRAWEIAIGAIASLFLLDKNFSKVGLNSKQFFSLVGFVLILLSVFLFNNDTPFPSVYALLPTVGAVLIILFAEKDTYIGKLLSTRIFVGVGLISYSAYLWHQPILVFARIVALSFGVIPKSVLLALIFSISIFSWKYIEAPFRKNDFFGRKFIFSCSIGASIFFALLGFGSSRALIDVNHESIMARELSTGVAIYASNMNERKFIKSRIEVETISPKTIVLGSSRIMQIGSRNMGNELLNLGMSGASVEDDVAIWKLVSERFNPDLVLIGVDPWLFNGKSGQYRWKTLEAEYYSALTDLDVDAQKSLIGDHQKLSTGDQMQAKIGNNILVNLYGYLNVAKIAAINDSPEYMDKIRRDGSRVYNLSYANKTSKEVESGAIALASYAMSPYEYSAVAEDVFKKLIRHIKSKHRVVLVLSPYHPKLYKFMVTQDKKFIEIEKRYRELAANLNVSIIGSYDPEVVGCSSDEFYDGMHPKDSCMNKIVNELVHNR